VDNLTQSPASLGSVLLFWFGLVWFGLVWFGWFVETWCLCVTLAVLNSLVDKSGLQLTEIFLSLAFGVQAYTSSEVLNYFYDTCCCGRGKKFLQALQSEN